MGNNRVENLQEKLQQYVQDGYYPFHMPGHKRNIQMCQMENPYGLDITEIDGFDNLHHAQGILQDMMTEAAGVYGAEKTYYLINGSSSGMLAAICACVRRGGSLLMARECHKSAYHAVYLRGFHPVYLYPQLFEYIYSGGYHQFYGGVRPEDVEAALSANPQAQAVVIVSPTYEGLISDIEKISAIAHRYECPLIVDEAHGAHFGFSPEFPQTAVRQGADLVIQSVHKTLPALTQTALLHVGREGAKRVDITRIERYLSIFQSSSPSYVLMAGIQKSLRFAVSAQGKQRFEQLYQRIQKLEEEAQALVYLHVYALPHRGEKKDPSKVIIFIDEASGRNGHWLYRILLERYRLQMEMESLHYVLAMTSIADTEEGFARLAQALLEIDRELCKKEIQGLKEDRWSIDYMDILKAPKRRPAARCSIQDALEADRELCIFTQAVGRVSAEYLYLYPPGIPILVPGEVFTKEFCEQIRYLMENGLVIYGLERDKVWLVL